MYPHETWLLHHPQSTQTKTCKIYVLQIDSIIQTVKYYNALHIGSWKFWSDEYNVEKDGEL